ncbi:helix-turn-helix domain-containing protein [Serratia sp. JUb9]|uniref:winged helix-turn-helix domain-containing protein n=1 Tax=Serratia sp. JUb9 TaxID=2724469 RepID=UPI00164E5C74|nr:helix-turn-helix domain-containing protein [Serratia sp. JUb9]QNK34323.1 helix-turn-helix domain-containing protein [Serratia sp. JUb9]
MDLDKRITIRNLNVLIPSRKSTRLRWKEYQILSLLVANSPELVTRAEIIESIWKGTYCSDSTINQTIKSIRQKIGDSDHTIIRTIPRLGYRVENRAIFNFLSDDSHDDEAILEHESLVEEDIQQESSESVGRGSFSEDMAISAERDSEMNQEKIAAQHPLWHTQPFKPQKRQTGTFSLLITRGVKLVSVLALFAVIANVFFYLGSQARPLAEGSRIYSPTRVMLTLKFSNADNPDAPSSRSLLCMYQGNKSLQVTIECIDPKKGRFRQQYRYDEIKESSEIQLTLPDNLMNSFFSREREN